MTEADRYRESSELLEMFEELRNKGLKIITGVVWAFAAFLMVLVHTGQAKASEPYFISGIFCDTEEQMMNVFLDHKRKGKGIRQVVSKINADAGKAVCANPNPAVFVGVQAKLLYRPMHDGTTYYVYSALIVGYTEQGQNALFPKSVTQYFVSEKPLDINHKLSGI